MPRTPQEFFNSNLRWTGVQKLYSFYIQYTLDKTYCFRSALPCPAPLCPHPLSFCSPIPFLHSVSLLSPIPLLPVSFSPLLFLVFLPYSSILCISFSFFHYLLACLITLLPVSHPFPLYSVSHSASFITCLPILLTTLSPSLFLYFLSLFQLLP